MLVVYFVNYLIMGDHQNPVILKDAAGVLSVSSESDMWTVYEGWRYMFGSEAFHPAVSKQDSEVFSEQRTITVQRKRQGKPPNRTCNAILHKQSTYQIQN